MNSSTPIGKLLIDGRMKPIWYLSIAFKVNIYIVRRSCMIQSTFQFSTIKKISAYRTCVTSRVSLNSIDAKESIQALECLCNLYTEKWTHYVRGELKHPRAKLY